MGCENCTDLELCSCEDGKNSFTITTAQVDSTSAFQNGGAGLSFAVSNVGQYTGSWAKKGSTVFLSYTNPSTLVTTTYGYYLVVSSTATAIVLKEHTTPFVGGAAFANNTVDFQQHSSGTITFPSGTFITSGGVKGGTGATAVPATLEGVFHGATTTADINPASTSYLTLATENIAASALIDVGDSLRIKACYYFSPGISTGSGNIKILFGGVSITEFSGIEPPLYDILPYIEVESVVSRVDNFTVDVRTFIKYAAKGTSNYSSEYVAAAGGSTYTTYQIIGATTTALTSATTVLFQGKVTSVGPPSDIVKLGYYLVENLQKI